MNNYMGKEPIKMINYMGKEHRSKMNNCKGKMKNKNESWITTWKKSLVIWKNCMGKEPRNMNNYIGKDKRCISCRRIEEATETRKTDWLTVFCSCRTMPLPTCHKLPRLLQLNVDLKAFLTPYILLIWPSDFYLFPKLKSHLRGTQYGSNEGIIEAVNEYLRGGGGGEFEP